MIGDYELFNVPLYRLVQLEKDSLELKRARALIARLRAENRILKAEKRRFFTTVEALKHDPLIAGNLHKKYGVVLVKTRLQDARLI